MSQTDTLSNTTRQTDRQTDRRLIDWLSCGRPDCHGIP